MPTLAEQEKQDNRQHIKYVKSGNEIEIECIGYIRALAEPNVTLHIECQDSEALGSILRELMIAQIDNYLTITIKAQRQE